MSIKIAKLPHYMKKLYQLGPRTAMKVVSNRMQNSFFEQYSRYQADHKKASYTWPMIAQKHGLDSFSQQWEILKKRSFVFSQDLYKKELSDVERLHRQAEAFANNCFDILGSRDQCLMVMPWHSDFRLRYQNPDADYLFDKHLFYKDFSIQFGLTDRLIKDIKVPWELSRCQHFYVLGAAYQKGHNSVYAQAFAGYVQDWLDENTFLLGPNWICPMDVGIRAFNWVWAFHFFKDASELDEAFWQRFTCSLYDHLFYLENNWEVYEKTSNHYLSDLLGYYALTWFFADCAGMQKKAAWCHKQFLKEFEKQVQTDGTDYEGSTAYHGLVTEIFYHFYLLAQEQGHAVPIDFVDRLSEMFTFIEWTTIQDKTRVTIGDDDSGKILFYGLTPDLVAHMKKDVPSGQKQRFFKEFGLAVYKDQTLHITLRHHAYKKEQPSGHFHNDVGSVTLAVAGIPVLVDPGSYVYTPSAVWRNQFRSVTAHNTFFIQHVEPVLFNERSLFNLDLPEHTVGSSPWQVKHDLYSIPAARTLMFKDEGIITLQDRWEEVEGHTFTSMWNFTFAPSITPVQKGSSWHLQHEGKTLVVLTCQDLHFTVSDSWYAPQYGTKLACKKLTAQCDLSAQSVTITMQVQH